MRLETFTAAEYELAQWLLEREAGPSADAAKAGQRVWDRLAPRLANIYTSAGNEALLRRALYISEGRFRNLSTVHEQPGLEGLDEALRGLQPREANEAAAVLLATIVHLLVTFIGQGLVLKLLAELWPGVTLESHLPGGEEGQT